MVAASRESLILSYLLVSIRPCGWCVFLNVLESEVSTASVTAHCKTNVDSYFRENPLRFLSVSKTGTNISLL